MVVAMARLWQRSLFLHEKEPDEETMVKAEKPDLFRGKEIAYTQEERQFLERRDCTLQCLVLSCTASGDTGHGDGVGLN